MLRTAVGSQTHMNPAGVPVWTQPPFPQRIPVQVFTVGAGVGAMQGLLRKA